MAASNPPGDNRHMAIFRVASHLFCAPASAIAAITDLPAWTRIPKAPPSILGAVNHRGQVVVVVSLRRKLGLEPLPAPERSQLIIAELETGLTGFVVDEVEDVRPPVDMQRHPLAATEAIDIFDAYRVDGKRILLETSFQKLFRARETPPITKNLETRLRRAEAHFGASLTSTATADTPPAPADPKPDPKASPAAERKTDSRARPVRDNQRPTETVIPSSRPGPGESQIAVTTSAREKGPSASPTWYGGPKGQAGHPPWYRYALVAALFLILTATLGAGVWLLRFKTGLPLQPPASDFRNHRTGPEQTPKTETGTTRRPSRTGPRVSADKMTPQAPSGTVNTLPPDENEVSMDRSPLPEEPPPPRPPARPPVPPGEVLRIESETFTLTVERPGGTSTAGRRPAAAAEEIRHIVVRGDTLWDIAAHYLGDPLQYPELARLSRIRDPDLIYPNDVIRIVRRPSGR